MEKTSSSVVFDDKCHWQLILFGYVDTKLDWIIPLTLEVSLTNRLAQELDAVTIGTGIVRVTTKKFRGKVQITCNLSPKSCKSVF